MKKKLLIILLCLLLVLSGCGAATNESMEMDMEMAAGDMPADNILYQNNKSESYQESTLPQNRKLIRTVRISAETKALDTLLEALDGKIAELGGYVESRNVYNGSARRENYHRSADMTIRIPVENADAFLAHVEGQSNVTSTSENLQDVTLTYVATESRMKALQTEEARLLELLAQANNVSELLEIESRLTDVRYELEKVTSQLKLFDNQIDYATIYLSVSEVVDLTVVEEQSVWQRMGSGFMTTLRGTGAFLVEAGVFLVTALPALVALGLAGTGVILLLRVRKRWKAAKKTAPPAQE